MNNSPLTRTNPTVKQSPVGNKRSLRWEMRLGLFQLVIFLGVVLGSITCSFLLGYHSGQRVGFDNALASTQATMARMPIGAQRRERKAKAADSTELYDDLGSSSGDGLAKDLTVPVGAKAQRDAKNSDIPQLGAIKDVDELPIEPAKDPKTQLAQNQAAPDNSVKTDLDALLDVEEKSDLSAAAAKGNAVIRVLGENNQESAKAKGAGAESNTLGTLIKKESIKPEALAPDLAPAADLGKVPHVKSEESTVTQVGIVEKSASTSTLAKASLAPDLGSNDVQALSERSNTNKQASAKSGIENSKGKVVSAAGSLAKPSATDATSKLNASRSGVGKKGWFAQVAAPRKRSDADDIATKLRSSGFPVSIETAKVSGEEYYRVLVGPEDNRQQAERLVSQLTRERYISGVPFIRMIK